MTLALTIAYIALFSACGWPAVFRIVRRGSSADCSVWREWTLLAGISMQATVMVITGASWYVLISPLASGLSIGTLLIVIYRFR